MKATSDDANPIQGYLYQEVNSILHIVNKSYPKITECRYIYILMILTYFGFKMLDY